MNPYDFVRIIWSKPGPRRPGPTHERFQGLSGRLEATITALTPIFLPDHKQGDPQQFLRSTAGDRPYLIPGSSLKGLFRNLVETVGGGAWWFLEDDHSSKIPAAFRRPSDIDRLDAACRMFGFMGEKGGRDQAPILAGHVNFGDAVCVQAKPHAPFYTVALLGPKSRHSIWYLDANRQYVAGRKFYFHATNAPIKAKAGARKDLSTHIQPLDTGSVFTFQAAFDNVLEEDFNLLLYAMVLEPEMRHKFGYAKPAGLGSVAITLNWIKTVDRLARYRAGGGGITHYAGDALTNFVKGRIASFVDDRSSITLSDLRRIWAWPARHELQYPGEAWFDANPTTPISGTP
ncbi:hypothetical protein K2Z83_18725 [Oscillochloris sp. ZM17-4]|uniref:RAMP superfamily CRISPR-associated protein n=1 Tax=Oscillochloris sp. ZM17-4 TaxID=2866714 RepID=UPI001C737863|nr:RAMP superfamily CRISPR-associated protein [Oscillochloris sp. ZM17-4]MBX0329709.1 hypothetical protein [Oscillochloris sp. ZM17-4]